MVDFEKISLTFYSFIIKHCYIKISLSLYEIIEIYAFQFRSRFVFIALPSFPLQAIFDSIWHLCQQIGCSCPINIWNGRNAVRREKSVDTAFSCLWFHFKTITANQFIVQECSWLFRERLKLEVPEALKNANKFNARVVVASFMSVCLFKFLLILEIQSLFFLGKMSEEKSWSLFRLLTDPFSCLFAK